MEAIGIRLQENPRGVLVAVDELAGVFGSLDCYRNGVGRDAQKYLELFGARDVRIDRASPDKPPMYIKRASCGITGTTQPAIIGRIMSGKHTDSGMLARFLLCMPPPADPYRAGTQYPSIPGETIERLSVVFCEALKLIDKSNNENRALPLSPEAWTMFDHWREEVSIAIHDEPEGAMKAALSKMECYAARLAGVLALTDDPGALEVQGEYMASAIILTKWYIGETRRVYLQFKTQQNIIKAERKKDVVAEINNKVIHRVNAAGGRISWRILKREMHWNSEQGEKMLAELIKDKIVHRIEEKNAKGVGVVWIELEPENNEND